jgi:hypothetical protein
MGAIYAVRPMVIRFCTITGNTTPAGRRGAVGSFGGGFTITVYSSIIAGNTNGDIGYNNSPSPFISQGYNLIGTGNNSSLASFNHAGDQTGVLNPMLGALADNGGATQTRIPLAGSPAIDAGNPAALSGIGGVPVYDQRGKPYTRVWDGDGAGGSRIDIGAVELQTQPLPAAVYGDYNADGVVDAGDYLLSRKMMDANVAPYTGADGSGNGIVASEDYSIWRAHFGETYAAGSGASIEGTDGQELLVMPLGNASAGVQADVGRRLQISSIVGAPYGTARQYGSGTCVGALAEPVAPEVLREDALVAWVESAGSTRANRAFEFEAMASDSTESETGVPFRDALDVAVVEFMSAAVL